MFSAFSTLLKSSALRQMTRDGLLSLDPERAHKATILALKSGLVPQSEIVDPKELRVNLAGLQLSNPIGMAAGFDKDAQVHEALGRIGFGLCEVGTLTPRPQGGNPRPRLFRLMPARAVINRMGFNNEGHDGAYVRLVNSDFSTITGVNIGANKDSEDFVVDYVMGVARFAAVADYLTMNISSPNTPGLRGLQSPHLLKRLLNETLEARAKHNSNLPIFLKIAPDMDEEAMDAIAKIIAPTNLDGLIVSNTTVSRQGVEKLPFSEEIGGLSGGPLFDLATVRLAQMRQRVGPKLAIIGVGGVHDTKSALAKFEAGANAIQLYTALVFGGLELLDTIKRGLVREIRRQKLKSISQIVGTKTDMWAHKKRTI